MTYNECYLYLEKMFISTDFSSIGKDFTSLIYITDPGGGYINMSYIGGQKSISPVKTDSCNIFMKMSADVFSQMVSGNLDPLKAFTTGKIQAKGNILLAMAIYNSFK